MLNGLLNSPEHRLRALRVSLGIFFVAGLLLSSTVWTNADRTFPMLPVIDGMGPFSNELNALLYLALIASLLIGSLLQRRWVVVVTLVVLVLFLVQDQMRWQPWVYLYFCMLFPFLFPKVRQIEFIPYFQLLLVGVYFWSGFYKLNPGFVEGTFDHMLEDLCFISNAGTRESLHWLGYSIPIIEMALAVLLIVPKYRKIAIPGIVLTHVIILSYLITAKHNTVVYPWNLAMISFVVILFYRNTSPVLARTSFDFRKQWLIAAGAFFFLFMPFLNLFGLWDSYLSFRLYSGNNGLYCIGIDKSELASIDPSMYPFLWKVDEPRDKYWVYVNKWAMDDLNVPFYSEMSAFRKVSKTFCEEFPREKLEFVRFGTDFVRDGAVVFTCEDCE